MIKCIGSSLYLKNNYGGGYKMSIVVNSESDIEYLKNNFPKIFPAAILIDNSGT